MAFSPLPTRFTDLLANMEADQSTVLELGSGEGHFQSLVQKQGQQCLGLDIRSPSSGAVCDLVGDARRPPIKSGSISLLVAANLVRHLVPRHKLPQYINQWRGMLKPGGSLFIFEDEPSQATRPERNFRDLQAFLAQLMPEARGPLMPLKRFQALVEAEENPGQWQFGTQLNHETIDAGEVVRFLAAGDGVPSGAVAGLIKSIGRDGLAPGNYWWAQVGPTVGDS